jgi:hypothetical protein
MFISTTAPKHRQRSVSFLIIFELFPKLEFFQFLAWRATLFGDVVEPYRKRRRPSGPTAPPTEASHGPRFDFRFWQCDLPVVKTPTAPSE